MADPAESAATGRKTAGAQVAAHGCAAALAEAEYHALAATYWFDSPTSGGPYSIAIRFAGVRSGVEGKHTAGDKFEMVERVGGIMAGSGRVAVTTRPRSINPGAWRVTATPLNQVADNGAAVPGASMARRLPQRVLSATTRLAPFVHGPGVRLGAWPSLVGLGVVVAIALQAALLARAQVDVMSTVAVSLAASVLGYVSAKIWYLVLHRQHPRTFLTAGACIQGFLVGGVGAMALAALALQLPVGTLFDATAPGLFLGMAIGRPGCFLTGCCAGRPTNSRWGLWSSDRRLGIRRFPVQLIEAGLTLLIGVAALALVLTAQPPIRGSIFIGAVATYAFGRQLLFPLRAESHTPRGRTLTMAVAGLVLLADLTVIVAT